MRVLTEWGQPGAAMVRTDATGKPTVIRRAPLLLESHMHSQVFWSS